MTWHLKDRELEKNLIKVDPEFLSKLNTACETLDTNKDGDFYKYQTCFVKLNHFGKIIGELFLTRDDIEYKTTYNPNAWNKYPEVTPPEGVLMRVEFIFDSILRRNCSIFENGAWRITQKGDPSYNITLDGVTRFRPWED